MTDTEKTAQDLVGLELVIKQMEEEIKHLITNNQKTKERLLFLQVAMDRVLGKLHSDIFDGEE